MRGKRAAQRSGRHRGATAIADDRHELRSPRSLPGSASVSPACAAGAAWERGRLARMHGRPRTPWVRGRLARVRQRHRTAWARARLTRPGRAGVSPACTVAPARPGCAGVSVCRVRAGGARTQGISTYSGRRESGDEGKRAAQQCDHRLRRASSRMACRLRISATSYLVGIEPAIGRIFTIAGNCPERP